MPRGRTKQDRVRHLRKWLSAHFVTPYPVTLRFTHKLPKTHIGLCSRVGRRLWIHLDPKFSEHVLVDTLLHEFAHAATWRHVAVEDARLEHDDVWALAYGRVYRKYHDEGGREKVRRGDL